MATVLQEYRGAVRSARPKACLVIIENDAGDRYYAIFDGCERLTGDEISPTIAWRQAEFNLTNPHLAIL